MTQNPISLFLSSTSKHFPLDLQPLLVAEGQEAKRFDLIDDFFSCPERHQPYLAIIEIGSTDDLDRALLAYEWCEKIQPLANCRVLLLFASKNIALGDRASRFGTAEVAHLPLPMKNLLFKVDLQKRLLQSEQGGSARARKNSSGFSGRFVDRPPTAERVLLVRGPGPKSGSWQESGESPQGKVRWRWVANAPSQTEKGGEKQGIAWVAESKVVPRYEPQEEAWAIEDPEAELQGFIKDKEIYSAIKAQAALRAEEEAAVNQKAAPAPNLSKGLKIPDEEVKKSAAIPGTKVEPTAPLASKKQNSPSAESGSRASTSARPSAAEPSQRVASSAKTAEAGKIIPAAIAPAFAASAIPAEKRPAQTDSPRTSQASEVAKPNSAPGSSHEAQGVRAPKPVATPNSLEAQAAPKESATSIQTAAAKAERNRNSETAIPSVPHSDDEDKYLGYSVPVSSARETSEPPKKQNPIYQHTAHASGQPDREGEGLKTSDSDEPPAWALLGAKIETEAVAGAQDPTPRDKSRKELDSSPLRKPAEAAFAKNGTPLSEPSKPQGQKANATEIPSTSAPQTTEKSGVEKNFGSSTVAAGAASIRGNENAPPTQPSSLEAAVQTKVTTEPPAAETRLRATPAPVNQQMKISGGNVDSDPAAVTRRLKAAVEAERSAQRAPKSAELENYLKYRHFVTLTLEELRDRDSSWHPVDGYRIYLSVHQRYYGVKDPASLLPLWVYEGELAPEFLENKQAWKFYDRYPELYSSLDTLPPALLEHVYRQAGIEPPVDRSSNASAKQPAAQLDKVAPPREQKKKTAPEPGLLGGVISFFQRIFGAR